MNKSEVKAHFYELAPGIFQASIVVFGWEYSYGLDGFSKSEPSRTTRHKCKRLKRGKTEKTEEELDAFIKAEGNLLMTSQKYRPLDNNCQHFAEMLCAFLKVSNLPRGIKLFQI